MVDFARHVADIPDATTAEYAPDATKAVVGLMEEQKAVADIGGAMRPAPSTARCATARSPLARTASP